MNIPMSEAVKYNRMKANITQLHECLGEYESEEWCGHCIVDSKCAQITIAVNELKDQLEAVKDWIKQELIMSPIDPPWYTKRIRQLSDILEAKK